MRHLVHRLKAVEDLSRIYNARAVPGKCIYAGGVWNAEIKKGGPKAPHEDNLSILKLIKLGTLLEHRLHALG